jgi:hypothetical protein
MGVRFRGVLTYMDCSAPEQAGGAGQTSSASCTLEVLSDSDGRTLKVMLGVPAPLVPVLERGRSYGLWLCVRRTELFTTPPMGIVIRGETGALVYMMDCNDAVPESESPAGVMVVPSDKVASVTTIVSRSGCAVSQKHRFVAVESQGRTALIAPGESRTFKAVSGRYEVHVLDNSKAASPKECEPEYPPHFSYVMLPAAAGR